MTRRVLELHVQPGARRTEFAGLHGGIGAASRRKRVSIAGATRTPDNLPPGI